MSINLDKKNRMSLKYWIIGLFMLPLLTACSDEDDIDAIFMGRTWKLSRIMQNKSTSALTPEEQKKVSESAEECFIIAFSGDHFSGRTLDTSFTGTWSVDGEEHTISFDIKGVDGMNPSDVASQKMLNILQHANKYRGDTQNLEIQHSGNAGYLLFYPLN